MARGEMIKNPDGEQTGPVFYATWRSPCAMRDWIDPDEEAVMFDGEAYHLGCAIDKGLRVPS